jgi:spore germination cell wall hydrolase CwlJ-like protein
MNFVVRAAPVAVLALVALGSAIVADPGFATASDEIKKVEPVSVPALTVQSSALLADDNVVFAEPAEVVQPVSQPQPAPAASLSSLVDTHQSAETIDREAECLAGAVYFEAKGESLDGQLAVAEVVLNRARSGRFPASVCSVVFQPGQFSFVRGGALPAINRDRPSWHRAVAIAHIARNDLWESSVDDALFFHASRVSPNWRKKRVAQVGNHVFYR